MGYPDRGAGIIEFYANYNRSEPWQRTMQGPSDLGIAKDDG